MAAQRGCYPQFIEPLMRVGLYHHGELLFDLDTDPGEQHNLIDQNPDMAQQLERLMQEFVAGKPMPEPVRNSATKADTAG